MNRREALRAWMAESLIVADGAVGTLLRSRGFPAALPVESAVLSHPSLVEELHRDYLRAGAQLLTTDTFRANRLHLSRHGLEDRLEEINRRGVELARRAAHGSPAWVGASVGPLKVMLRPYGEVTEEEAREVCRQQVRALAAAEPDLFVVETQSSVLEALFFLEACREAAPHLPVLVSLTVGREGRTFFGDSPVEGLRRLAAAGADVVGLNCSQGPADLLPFVEEMARRVDHPLSAMPNGGYPAEVDGRIVYLSSPEYVATYARRYADLGVHILGGCCGTTPETIAAIAAALKGRRPLRRKASEEGRLFVEEIPPPPEAPPREAGGFFSLLGRRFVVSCEIDPPRGADARPAVESARLLKGAGADAVNLAENPMARVRAAPLAVGHFIRQETGLTTILHMTCRDRNLLGLQSELLGAALLGVEGILALSGDPAALGDFPSATSVNDVNVTGLVRIVASLNRGLDFSDNPIGTPTRFTVGVGVSLAARDPAAERRKLEERCAAGATFAFSQPVFSLETVERFLEGFRDPPLPVLPGILPLSSLRQALYFQNEVPGMEVPAGVLARLEALSSPQDQAAYGLDLAREFLAGVRRLCPGAYLTAGGRASSVLAEVLKA
ncbi:MAG: bifunctional homocysteine S-methyltransferase/methylenetetrahydrofolate reductase [Acidobacteriota bacterium]